MAGGGSIFGSYLAAIAYNEDFATLSGRTRQNIMAQNLAREDSAVVPSCVFAGVGGYYASKQSGLAGVFRRAADGSDWKHALSEIEAFTVFVHPHDPNLVFAGTADGVYRSTDRGQNFGRAEVDAGRRLAGFDLSQRGWRCELEPHAGPAIAHPRQDAVFLPRDAVRAALSPSRRDFCRARSLGRNTLNRLRRELE